MPWDQICWPPMYVSQLSGCSMYGAVANTIVPKTATTVTTSPSSARRRNVAEPRSAGTFVALAMLDMAHDVEVISPGVVVARTPVDDVTTVVVGPELVVPGTAEQRVVAGAAFEVIVARPPDQDVVAAQAEELVVAAEAANDVAAHRAEHDVRAGRTGIRAGVLRRAGNTGTGQARAHDRGKDQSPLHAEPTSSTSPVSSLRRAHSPARSSSTAFAPRAAAVRHGRTDSAMRSTRPSRSRKTMSIGKRMKNVCTEPAGRSSTPSSDRRSRLPRRP